MGPGEILAFLCCCMMRGVWVRVSTSRELQEQEAIVLSAGNCFLG